MPDDAVAAGSAESTGAIGGADSAAGFPEQEGAPEGAQEGAAGAGAGAGAEGGEMPASPESRSDSGWRFEFDGRTFRDPEEARQYFGSWNGRLRTTAQRLNQAIEALNEWDTWYQQNRDRIEQALRSSGEAQKGSAESGGAEGDAAAAGLAEELHWDFVEDLLRQGRGADALRYLAMKNDEFLQSQVQRLREEVLGQLQGAVGPLQEQQLAREAAVQIMLAAKDLTDEEGNPVFPEFQEGQATFDPEFVRAFGNVWRQLPAHIAYDPNLSGVELAYWRTKQMWQQRGAQANGAGAAAAQAAEAARGRFMRQAEAQAQAIGGSASGKADEAAKPEEEAKRAIRNAARYNADFGVWE